MDFIELRDGPVLPVVVIELALRFEDAGLFFEARPSDRLAVIRKDGQRPVISDEDRAIITKHKAHIQALVVYCESTTKQCLA